MKEIIKICPVSKGWLYADEAKYRLDQPEGFYLMDVLKREIKEKVDELALLKLKSSVKGVQLGGVFVPSSFDQARRHFGKASIPVFHNPEKLKPEDFEECRFLRIRGELFMLGFSPPAPDLSYVSEQIRNGEGLEFIKGMTPESIYLVSCFKMQWEEEKRRLQEGNLEWKLRHALEYAGGRLLSFKKTMSGLIDVAWEITAKLRDSRQTQTRKFSSLIREDNLNVYHAGFCVSGADDKHSLATIASVAKLAVATGGVHVTRQGQLPNTEAVGLAET